MLWRTSVGAHRGAGYRNHAQARGRVRAPSRPVPHRVLRPPRGSLGGARPGQGAADRSPAAPAARPLPHVRAPRRRHPPVTSAAAAARRQQLPGHRDPGAVLGKRGTARVGLGFAVGLHAARPSSEQPPSPRPDAGKRLGKRAGPGLHLEESRRGGARAERGWPAARAAPSGVSRPFLSWEKEGGGSGDPVIG